MLYVNVFSLAAHGVSAMCQAEAFHDSIRSAMHPMCRRMRVQAHPHVYGHGSAGEHATGILAPGKSSAEGQRSAMLLAGGEQLVGSAGAATARMSGASAVELLTQAVLACTLVWIFLLCPAPLVRRTPRAHRRLRAAKSCTEVACISECKIFRSTSRLAGNAGQALLASVVDDICMPDL